MNFSEDIAIFRPSHIEKLGGLTRGWRPRSKNPFRIKLVPSEGSDVALGTLMEVKGTPASEHTTETMFVKVGEWSEEIFATIAADGITAQGLDIYASEIVINKVQQDIDYFIATVVGVYGAPVSVMADRRDVLKMELDGRPILPTDSINFGDNATHELKIWMDMTTLSKGIFNGTDLMTLAIPQKITTIEEDALADMPKLTSVVVYNTDAVVSENVLRGSNIGFVYFNGDGLVKVWYCGSPDIVYTTVSGTIIDAKSVPAEVNRYVNGRGEIILSRIITTIPQYWQHDNSDLKTIDIIFGVEVLDSFAFMKCTALETVALPSTVKEIKGSVFSGCNALSEVVISAEVPPTIKGTSFPAGLGSIRVPEASVDAYKAAPVWTNYADRITSI